MQFLTWLRSSVVRSRVRLGFTRRWIRSPVGLRCVLSCDLAVSSSIFVETQREENLIRNDPDKSELSKKNVFISTSSPFIIL